MNKAHIEFLRDAYNESCENILRAFCDMLNLKYEPNSWVANDVGTIACVGDYFFDFNDIIKYCVLNSIDNLDELIEWYDYSLWANEFNQDIPNFKSWHNGCPRFSKEQQKRLIDLKKQLDDTITQYKESVTTTDKW